jgi:hypothetical protein
MCEESNFFFSTKCSYTKQLQNDGGLTGLQNFWHGTFVENSSKFGAQTQDKNITKISSCVQPGALAASTTANKKMMYSRHGL